VARAVFPTTTAAAGVGECERYTGTIADYSPCPVTDRLRTRLEEHPTGALHSGAEPFCRCQNSSRTIDITVDAVTDGAIAHVGLFAYSLEIDLVMKRENGRLLVDDMLCNNDSQTSFYNPVVGPCPEEPAPQHCLATGDNGTTLVYFDGSGPLRSAGDVCASFVAWRASTGHGGWTTAQNDLGYGFDPPARAPTCQLHLAVDALHTVLVTVEDENDTPSTPLCSDLQGWQGAEG